MRVKPAIVTVSKISSRQFLDQLAQLADAFRQRIETECEAFELGVDASAERRARVLGGDLEFFARTYFPHYVKAQNSVVHDYLYRRLPTILFSDKGERDAIAAPRGEAKSTIVSQIAVLFGLATGRLFYPCIVMDAFEQAAEMLEAIKAELEFNQRLATDFPELCGQGRVWRAGVIVTANNRKVEAFGSGKKMRGRRHGPYRPDFIVLDDIENDDNVRSPEQRDKLERWVKRTVLSLGSADDTCRVVLIGTVLHYDSVLNRFIKNPLWRSKAFRAIIAWPDHMDLWDEWEELLLNAGEEAALRFYQQHAADMEAGAVVSWPAMRPLYKLMVKRARDGHDAFDSEQQNDPAAGEGAPFDKCIHFWVNKLADWIMYGACDPSLGRLGASRDPSAILVGGFNRFGGVDKQMPILDVVEAKIRKRLPDRIIEDIIAMQREYRCVMWAFESVQFQEFLRTELLKRSALRGIPVPARPVMPHADKILRIESMQPYCAAEQIRVHPSQTTLIQQLRHFPKADHDDGPDALQMLWMLAVSHTPIEFTSASQHLREMADDGGGDDPSDWFGIGAF